MSKHTPGPWIIDTKNDGINYKGNFIKNFECSIKSMPDSDGMEWFIALIHQAAGMNEIEGETETIDNAKLISAAPDLLEALKIVEKQSGIMWDSKKGKDFEVGAMLHIIREAIKKAEGQS